MSGPIEPVEFDSLIFINFDGARQLGRPNDRERDLARRLAVDSTLWRVEPMMLATVLAAVREGSTLEGRRQLVTAHVTVFRLTIDATEGEAEQHATRAVWRRWFDELHRLGLRPVGWPAVQRTHLDLGVTFDESQYPERRGLVVVDPDGPRPWVFLELRLECEAVPA